MIVTTALLLTALYAGTPQDPVQPVSPVSAPAVEEQRISTGIILASAVEGRIAIFDSQGRLVVELDKPAGRSLEVALEPGAYEVRFQSVPPVVRFQVRDGDRFVLEPRDSQTPSAPSQEKNVDLFRCCLPYSYRHCCHHLCRDIENTPSCGHKTDCIKSASYPRSPFP